MIEIVNADCRDYLREIERVHCIFADPPDNIGLTYDGHNDGMDSYDYLVFMEECIRLMIAKADVVWLSFNSRWILDFARIVDDILWRRNESRDSWEVKTCVQTFTFGQHNKHDLGNNHRPLWRIMQKGYPIYPDSIRIESERQKAGDKRAHPGGRVPGDVFDFPRVTGNSKQRRRWHPTQLHEGLVERCIKLVTQPGALVLDPFAGTGTTGRVCRRIDRECILVDVSPTYCEEMKLEFGDPPQHH